MLNLRIKLLTILLAVTPTLFARPDTAKKPPTSQPLKPLTEAESNAVGSDEYKVSFRVPKKWSTGEEPKSDQLTSWSYDMLGGATGTLAYARVRVIANRNTNADTLDVWVQRIKESTQKWNPPPAIVTDEKFTWAGADAWLLLLETKGEIEYVNNYGSKTKKETTNYVHQLTCVKDGYVYTLTFNSDGVGYKARLKQLDRVLATFKFGE